MTVAVPSAGFAEPVEAAQRHFRALLTAMANPGRVVPLQGEPPSPPPPLNAGAFALALSLLDQETTVWLAPSLRREDVTTTLRFHCGCPIAVDPGRATFAFACSTDELGSLERFAPGTAEYPDTAATIVLQASFVEPGAAAVILTGPGIEAEQRLQVAGLAPSFWREVQANRRDFPLGIDLVLVAEAALAAVPRSTTITVP